MQAATGEAADTRPGSSRQVCGQASVRPCLGLFSATLIVRSLREAAEDAQPLPGTSAGTRGHRSQPRACHENLGGGFRSRTAILDAKQLHPGMQICQGGPGEAAPVPPLRVVLTIGRLPSSGRCEARGSVTAQSPSTWLEDQLAPRFASLLLTQGAIACR
jgi:hypothetical protein